MTKEKPDYLSYLLRLWRVNGDAITHHRDAESQNMGKAVWRASLESTRTGQRRGFANLGALFDFLQQQISATGDTNRNENEK
jgi:hypothetical protein